MLMVTWFTHVGIGAFAGATSADAGICGWMVSIICCSRLARFLQGGHLVGIRLMQRGLLLLNHLPGGHRVKVLLSICRSGRAACRKTPQNATAALNDDNLRVHVLFISHPYPWLCRFYTGTPL